jgi:hypothetical protein
MKERRGLHQCRAACKPAAKGVSAVMGERAVGRGAKAD